MFSLTVKLLFASGFKQPSYSFAGGIKDSLYTSLLLSQGIVILTFPSYGSLSKASVNHLISLIALLRFVGKGSSVLMSKRPIWLEHPDGGKHGESIIESNPNHWGGEINN